jgi:site-specific recombinase XerD
MKTGVPFLSVLLDEAAEIVKRYDYELPILSNQKYNSYLKEIGDLCEISKPMHTHIGRHTAATYLLNKGIPIETVAKMLGHSNIKQTQHYAKLVDKTIFKEIAKIERN